MPHLSVGKQTQLVGQIGNPESRASVQPETQTGGQPRKVPAPLHINLVQRSPSLPSSRGCRLSSWGGKTQVKCSEHRSPPPIPLPTAPGAWPRPCPTSAHVSAAPPSPEAPAVFAFSCVRTQHLPAVSLGGEAAGRGGARQAMACAGQMEHRPHLGGDASVTSTWAPGPARQREKLVDTAVLSGGSRFCFSSQASGGFLFSRRPWLALLTAPSRGFQPNIR